MFGERTRTSPDDFWWKILHFSKVCNCLPNMLHNKIMLETSCLHVWADLLLHGLYIQWTYSVITQQCSSSLLCGWLLYQGMGLYCHRKAYSWELSFDLWYMPWVTFDLFSCINIDVSLHINNFVKNDKKIC